MGDTTPTDDAPDGAHDAVTAIDDDTFQPGYGVPDRVVRRVHTDHAPNAALHATLDAAANPDADVDVALMASHAPGERPDGPAPTYHVQVETRNAGGGHPLIPSAVRDLVDRDHAVITDVVACSDDTLRVAIRPVATRVEPVTVPYDALPDDVTRDDDAGRYLLLLADKIQHDETYAGDVDEAAKRLREFAHRVFDTPAEWKGPIDERVENALDDTFTFDEADVDRFRPFVEAWTGDLNADTSGKASTLSGLFDVNPYSNPYRNLPYPTARPPIGRVRAWVEDTLVPAFASEGVQLSDKQVDRLAEDVADAIQSHVMYGDPTYDEGSLRDFGETLDAAIDDATDGGSP